MTSETVRILFGHIFEENAISLKPLKEGFLATKRFDQNEIVLSKDTSQRFAISGATRVPHRDGLKSVRMNGIVTLKINEKTNHEIVECEGETCLGTWDLAKGIVLSDCRIRLSCRDGKPTTLLTAALRTIDSDDFETGGILDTEILHDPKDPDRLYLGTLVKDAYLNIGKYIRLSGATIRFELCTKHHEHGKQLPYFIHEMDEYLFQCTEPIPLASMHISGIGEKPITMSISINALSPDAVRTFLFVYPARLRVCGLGENTFLFISGSSGDKCFTIDLSGNWSASISSSPYLHLLDLNDPEGPALVEGPAFFIGCLEGLGLSSVRLSLSSPLTNAVAFPQSKWPQKLPEQKISFSVSETGTASIELVFNPLAIEDYLITSAEEKEYLLYCSLNESGLVFKGGYSVTRKSSNQPPRVLPPFNIDNQCRVWVEAGDKKIEIGNWIEKAPFQAA